MQIKTSADLSSEVEKRSSEVKAGMILYYVDSANCQKWNVQEVFEDGFLANDGKEEEAFFFYELQYGWQFAQD